jgi:hypothetical protein
MDKRPSPISLSQFSLLLALVPAAVFLCVIVHEAFLLWILGLSLDQIPISVSDVVSIGARMTPFILTSIFGIAAAEFLMEKPERGLSANILGNVKHLVKEYWKQLFGGFLVLLLTAGISVYLNSSWGPILWLIGAAGGILLAEFIYELFSEYFQRKIVRYVMLWLSILIA